MTNEPWPDLHTPYYTELGRGGIAVMFGAVLGLVIFLVGWALI